MVRSPIVNSKKNMTATAQVGKCEDFVVAWKIDWNQSYGEKKKIKHFDSKFTFMLKLIWGYQQLANIGLVEERFFFQFSALMWVGALCVNNALYATIFQEHRRCAHLMSWRQQRQVNMSAASFVTSLMRSPGRLESKRRWRHLFSHQFVMLKFGSQTFSWEEETIFTLI